MSYETVKEWKWFDDGNGQCPACGLGAHPNDDPLCDGVVREIPEGYTATFAEYLAEMQMPLASSNLKSIRYNTKTEELVVWFRSGGVYQYDDVPLSMVRRLKRAASRGKFFHKYIRFNYTYTMLKPARKGYTNSFNTHHKSHAHGVHADEKLDK